MAKTKWLLKACPRCGGDLFSEDGTFTCLQCGHRVEVRNGVTKRAARLPVGSAGRS